MNEITKADIEIIDSQDNATLAQWNCELNRWNWPEELPDEDKSHESKNYSSGGRRSQLMSLMEERVGHRLISRTWNKDMTDDEHDDFFNGTFCGDKEANARYEARLKSKHGI